jgi:hypothetical protein
VQAGTGIAEILSLEINRQGKHTLEEARKKIYLVDSKVIIFRNVFSNSHSVVSLAHLNIILKIRNFYLVSAITMSLEC